MEERYTERNVLERILDGCMKPRDLRLSLLENITENFSDERIIGEGGFGTVYKGVLRNREVAVKRIRNNHTIDETLFRREVNNLMKVNHQNIVRFLGFCSNTEHKAMEYEGEYIYAEDRERILCFEYVNNGSLDKFITDELRGLEWNIRYNIIKGICEGLEYLHMEKHIIHMDLKPANVLLDNDMVAKITDFGLSRLDERSHTLATKRNLTLGYCAPEYLHGGRMSVKSDVYSLGVIIIELVMGRKDIPDNNNVLRRWRHRWGKSGEETPFRYQQIAKLIEIGLLCQENDPYKRPFISEIIRDINEMEYTDRQISSDNESIVEQISPYLEDDMLGVEPLELRFPFELNKQTSCSLQLTNETNAYIAFSIRTTSPLPFCIEPNKDIVAPRSKYSVNITLQPLDKAPQDKQYSGDFIVRSTKVNESLTSEDITEDMFNIEEDKVVDEVNLTVVHEPWEPHVNLSLEALTISGTENLNSLEASNLPAEAESKISSSTLDELIQFDPPELCFPLVPDKKVMSSVKIVNITDFYVGFSTFVLKQNTSYYYTNPLRAILPPRSTQCLMVTRVEREEALKDMQFSDKYFVWNAIVTEAVKDSDLDCVGGSNESKELPIVLTKISPCTSNELIQFDPPELSFSLLPNKPSISSVNIVNITDCYISFNTYVCKKNVALYSPQPQLGILPPRSTQRILVKGKANEKELEDMQCADKLGVWNMVVAEGVEASNLIYHMDEEDIKELPIILKKISPFTSDDLIRFDPPQLCFTFLKNKTLLSSVDIVNITDYYIGFNTYLWETNAWYHIEPDVGILPPQSTQRLVVERVPKEKELEDMHCEDKFFVWNCVINEGVKVSDLSDCFTDEEGKELPIILEKISSSTSNELIQIEPPELCFPFLPNKSLLSSIKIANITDYFIGFNTFDKITNVALYDTEPPCGILPPRSTQELVVTRVAEEKVLEHMQCKDKYFVWSSFVTEGVNAIDLKDCMSGAESKELPIVFMETSSSELIQFDPPELCLPLLPNKSVLSSVKIVNITDHYIGFNICTKKSNSGRYYTNPSEGILPPRSTQVLMITRIAEEKELEDTECKDKYLVWNGIVTEGVKASDVVENMSETKVTELPIVLTKGPSSPATDELIQFDPPELSFPFLPNKKVLSSIKIINITDYYIGFNTYSWKTNAAWYHTEPLRGILPPRSTQGLMVTKEGKKDAVEDTQFNDKYFVWNNIVTEGVKDTDLADYKVDQESKVLPIVLTKTSLSTNSDELIQFDPPELCFPFLPNRTSLSRVNIVNVTDYYIGFNIYSQEKNAALCSIEPGEGILPPRSTKKLVVKRVAKEKELEDMPCKDSYLVWNSIVTKCVEASDIIDYKIDEESKELPIVLQKTNLSTSEELIQFDPPEYRFPFFPNQRVSVLCLVKMVNVTDHYVSFSGWNYDVNSAEYYINPCRGIMPPRSTQAMIVRRVPKEKEPEDMQCKDQDFMWYGIVTEGIEVSDLNDWADYVGKVEESKELPIVLTKTNLPTSNELIQFDPPELRFPFLPNKRVSMLCLFKIINNTDHSVGFYVWSKQGNSAWYHIDPSVGILPPRSTQAIRVKRTATEKELEEMQCKDQVFVWNGIVTEGVEVSHFNSNHYEDQSQQLPIVLTKTSVCTSNELIQFDPPQLRFPFLPNKRVSMLCLFKIVNVTDHSVGFSTWVRDDSSASYQMEPDAGILPPQSTQTIKVTRTATRNEPEDMQCKDKVGVWSGIVTEGVEVSDVNKYWNEYQDKELPIVLTKTSCTSNELIQFDPPQLRFPFLRNKRVSMLCLFKIVNVTDRSVVFSTWVRDDNSVSYQMEPDAGVLPPQSTQTIIVTRTATQNEPEDMQCKDKVGVCSGIATEGVEVSNEYWNKYQDKELPIALTKPGQSSSM